MAKDILMPQMGYDMTEGTIVRWLKKVGDKVSRGDIVAEIETDKATVEIEAFDSGTMLRTLAESGDTVPVGQPIATLGEKGESLPESEPMAAPAAEAAAPAPAAAAPAPAAEPEPAAAAPEPAAAQAASPAASTLAPGERPKASPLARRLAEGLGVDLATIAGTGPAGRITAEDVEGAAAAGSSAPAAAPVEAPAAAPVEAPADAPAPAAAPPPAPAQPVAPPPEGAEDIEPTRLRKAIARRMSESKRTAPHFYVSVDIRADAMLAARKKLVDAGTKVSVNDYLVRALALAAKEHPEVNAAAIDDKIRRFSRVDVGIAVATDNGLLSPAILDCAAKPVEKIAEEARDLAERARAGHLKPEEYGGGTITLSNLGMYGTDQFLAILNPPQALIVSVGAAADRVVITKGKPAAAKVLTAWAAADHRVLDGADVARFLATFRELVEDPGRLAGKSA
ncbi:MAG TPA: dihydrolipoamide acetyltransferase family protein [Candidatus Dormibacteraeota bacterium]|nr:dihydrolipoamide acetyltransferase family protein [Candidatus Dormibacteraeota bacterium]